MLGKDIGYSFSRDYFSKKFQAENLKHQYVNFDLTDLSNFGELLMKKDISGMNVTIPYKQDVIPFLDKLDPVAEAIGAVNTIVFTGGEKIGYNTDYIGFKKILLQHIKIHQEQAFVLGTGGAAKAICYVLEQLNIKVLKVSRNEGKDKKTYAQLTNKDYIDHTLIINCTPLGTHPHTEAYPPIDFEQINNSHLLYDLIYNPETTTFMKMGIDKGAKVLNGYQMLVEQAEASWSLWMNAHK
ncbi:shikimate dehydrogenase [Flavobacteriaceae bacterium]|nr:shikimate dehydrogenase [Flavobacteriaceae bacterium]